jgi:hypothetical protein
LAGGERKPFRMGLQLAPDCRRIRLGQNRHLKRQLI